MFVIVHNEKYCIYFKLYKKQSRFKGQISCITKDKINYFGC